eukprot:1176611-Prorocentrum_minimum.AAC.2
MYVPIDPQTRRAQRSTTQGLLPSCAPACPPVCPPAEYSSPRPITTGYPQNIPHPDQSRRGIHRIFLTPTNHDGVRARDAALMEEISRVAEAADASKERFDALWERARQLGLGGAAGAHQEAMESRQARQP